MKKYFIVIGAVAVLTTAFVYIHRESPTPQTISIHVTPNETVLAVMSTLASTSDFTFTGHDYPGLGFFVDSINGTKNAGGKYWMLYVNGTSSATGVSATILRTGDTVEWKYEKNF